MAFGSQIFLGQPDIYKGLLHGSASFVIRLITSANLLGGFSLVVKCDGRTGGIL